MGISSSITRLLMREAKLIPFKGSILQLGRQDIFLNQKIIQLIASWENYKLESLEEDYPLRKSRFYGEMCINDEHFFKMLGFSLIHSLDINNYESPNVLHDMNVLISPESNLINKYDVVFDGGTMEHVFHIPNFLRNVFNLLAVNGRVIHAVPVDLFNHGFYNFSVCLFEDFYKANNFEINSCWILKTPYGNEKPDSRRYFTSANSNSQFIRSLNSNTFDGGTHNLVFVATKLSASTGDVIPVQGYYKDLFSGKSNIDNNGLIEGNSQLKLLYKKLRAIPVISSLSKHLRDSYARSLVKWESI